MKSRMYPDWHAKVVEPVKRNKDGVQWIIHRFPIKGGISLRDAMAYDMMNQPNPFISMLERVRVSTQGETT